MQHTLQSIEARCLGCPGAGFTLRAPSPECAVHLQFTQQFSFFVLDRGFCLTTEAKRFSEATKSFLCVCVFTEFKHIQECKREQCELLNVAQVCDTRIGVGVCLVSH